MDLILFDCENFGFDMLNEQVLNVINSDIILIIGNMQSRDRYKQWSDIASIVKCETIAKNAADFVLVSELSLSAASKKYREIKVISDDTGFDAAITHLNKLGFNVKRQSPKQTIFRIDLPGGCERIVNCIPNGTSMVNAKVKLAEVYGEYRADRILSDLVKLQLIRVSKKNQIYYNKQQLSKIVRDFYSKRVRWAELIYSGKTSYVKLGG